MELTEAIELIQTNQLKKAHEATWADLGCGSGLFTAALAYLLHPGSMVYAIDKNPVKLQADLFPSGIEVTPIQLDFISETLPLVELDGIMMANALHYVKDKKVLIKQLSAKMKLEGKFLIVEYDTDRPVKPWVPYPVSFRALGALFESAGYSNVMKLGERPSVYSRASLYAAIISKAGIEN